ncbi:hypothetical protein [Streptomyces sp. NPDC057686]|uniref:hypothetical protein n=1 Tax=Streptomyces sp. NPDC057686 TaxID=3346212 RepID=UPI0036AC79C3
MRAATKPACATAPLPPPAGLTWDQATGRACIICNQRLTVGAVYRGWIREQIGAHRLDKEVWSCPGPEAT